MELIGTPVRAGNARGRVHVGTPEERGPGDSAVVLCLDELPPRDVTLSSIRWAGAIIGRPAVPDVALTGPPVVGGLECAIFRDGDLVTLDGGNGRVDLAGVTEVRVVTSFLERGDGRVLLLRRSQRVGSFRGRWAGVSGFLEDPLPLDQAVREIAEETGIARRDLDLKAAGPLLHARNEEKVYVVAPFRFRTRSTDVRLDWEHSECAWVDPPEIRRLDTVPRLDVAWASVAPIARREPRPNT